MFMSVCCRCWACCAAGCWRVWHRPHVPLRGRARQLRCAAWRPRDRPVWRGWRHAVWAAAGWCGCACRLTGHGRGHGHCRCGKHILNVLKNGAEALFPSRSHRVRLGGCCWAGVQEAYSRASSYSRAVGCCTSLWWLVGCGGGAAAAVAAVRAAARWRGSACRLTGRGHVLCRCGRHVLNVLRMGAGALLPRCSHCVRLGGCCWQVCSKHSAGQCSGMLHIALVACWLWWWCCCCCCDGCQGSSRLALLHLQAHRAWAWALQVLQAPFEGLQNETE